MRSALIGAAAAVEGKSCGDFCLFFLKKKNQVANCYRTHI